MASRKNVQDAHMSANVRALHEALISVIGVMNRPDVDERMVREAGIALDGSLFPLLVTIERLGPIGIVELAGRSGRDYTTVSRQVSRLETQGLVERRAESFGHRADEDGSGDGETRMKAVLPKAASISPSRKAVT